MPTMHKRASYPDTFDYPAGMTRYQFTVGWTGDRIQDKYRARFKYIHPVMQQDIISLSAIAPQLRPPYLY